jgi:hypothetical protein
MVFLLAACSSGQPQQPTLDPAMIYTQAAQTVQAQLAQTEAAKPTEPPTPIPTETSIPLPTLPPTEVPSPTGLPTLPELPTQPVLAPSATQPATRAGDHATFQYNVPGDNTVLQKGQKFILEVGWLNSGSTTWNTKYKMVFMGGVQMWGVTSVPLEKDVKPGQKGIFSIAQTAPDKAGKYITRWKLVNASGVFMGEMYFSFTVQ